MSYRGSWTSTECNRTNSCLCLVAKEFPFASIQSAVCKATLAGNSNTLACHVHWRKLTYKTHTHVSTAITIVSNKNANRGILSKKLIFLLLNSLTVGEKKRVDTKFQLITKKEQMNTHILNIYKHTLAILWYVAYCYDAHVCILHNFTA